VSDPGFTSIGPVPEMTKATYYFRFYLARALSTQAWEINI